MVWEINQDIWKFLRTFILIKYMNKIKKKGEITHAPWVSNSPISLQVLAFWFPTND
jgi:hypothetical protein